MNEIPSKSRMTITKEEKPMRLLPKTISNGDLAFPWKLHIVLEESQQYGFETIISWQGDRAFKVHDQSRFESCVMKNYFNNTQYKTFQRQLNIYGFQRVASGKYPGSYTHTFLARGKPDICRFMTRTKIKKKGARSKKKNSGDPLVKGNNTIQLDQPINKQDYNPDRNIYNRSMNCSSAPLISPPTNIIEPFTVNYDSIDDSNRSVQIFPGRMEIEYPLEQNHPDLIPCDLNQDENSLQTKYTDMYEDKTANIDRMPLSAMNKCVQSMTMSVVNKVVDSGNMVFDNSSFSGCSLSSSQKDELREEQYYLISELERLLRKQRQFFQQQENKKREVKAPEYPRNKNFARTESLDDHCAWDPTLDLETIFEDDSLCFDFDCRRTPSDSASTNFPDSDRFRNRSLMNVFDD